MDFEELVAQALDSLPEEFVTAMQNVEVVVEDEPPADVARELAGGGTLLGLYHGIPLPERGHYSGVLPDKISIYKGPITRLFRTPEAIKEQVRKTVIHEIGHHFGIDDARLHDLGY